jgi:hypothetical protein
MLKNLRFVSRNKSNVFLLVLALIVGGVGAQATGVLNTQSGGYLVCVNSKTKVVTHPGTSKCPKGTKRLVLSAEGKAGKDGNTLWNSTTDPISTFGAPGDFFINSATNTFFGPKNLDGTWPAGVSVVGPKGDQGPIGLTGVTGSQGSGGGSGPAGPQGVAGSNATLTCAQGGTCELGNTGPGGGKVFYVQTPTTAAPWRYMEAAPNTWSGGSADPLIKWCSDIVNFVPNLESGNTTLQHTFISIGAGYTNTQKMLRGCTFGAANAAAAYNGGGKSDWHLPSKDELNELYLQKTTVGGFVGFKYWSSSEILKTSVWYQVSGTGVQDGDGKGSLNYVRPVRAF